VSGFMGKTQQLPTVDDKTQGVHNALMDYITSQGFGSMNPDMNFDPAAMAPYQKMFQDQLNTSMAGAKESAGNLTGSGLGNYLGRAAGEAANRNTSFLANLFEQHKQAQANRFMQLMLGGMGSPAGQVQNVYSPGFMDYMMQAGNVAASAMPGSGNKGGDISPRPLSGGAGGFTGEDRGSAPWQQGY
jgi:hypothetical protein